MIEITDCRLGSVVDDSMMTVVLRGLSEGAQTDCSIQITLEPDEQDKNLGHEGVYAEIGGTGHYGIVKAVHISGRSELRLMIDAKAAKTSGVNPSDTVFKLRSKISDTDLNVLRDICHRGGFGFSTA